MIEKTNHASLEHICCPPNSGDDAVSIFLTLDIPGYKRLFWALLIGSFDALQHKREVTM